jgi:hypothetical protein
MPSQSGRRGGIRDEDGERQVGLVPLKRNIVEAEIAKRTARSPGP